MHRLTIPEGLTSAEIAGENAPKFRTVLRVPVAGTYDLWVNFWANPGADWRVRAGLSETQTRLFRQMACKQVEAGDHQSAVVLSAAGGTVSLYQAYAGRVTAAAGESLRVYVDDDAVQTGTTGTLIGNTARTWYDGVSYATVSTGPTAVAGEGLGGPASWALAQNYPNPFNPVTSIEFSVGEAQMVTLTMYDLLGREVAVLVHEQKAPGRYRVGFDGARLSSGVYFYRLTARPAGGGAGAARTEIRKMILAR